MGKTSFESRCKAIEAAIIDQQLTIDYLDRRLEATQKREDEEEAAMERADITKDMASRTKALKLIKSSSATSPGTGRTQGTVSSGLSLCLHPSVSGKVTKVLHD